MVAETASPTERASMAEPLALRERLDGARDQLRDLDTRARKLVKDQPIAVVCIFLFAGYLLGRLLARR